MKSRPKIRDNPEVCLALLRFKLKACNMVRTHVKLIVEEAHLWMQYWQMCELENETNLIGLILAGQCPEHDHGLVYNRLPEMEGRSGPWDESYLPLKKSFNQFLRIITIIRSCLGQTPGTKSPKWWQFTLKLACNFWEVSFSCLNWMTFNSVKFYPFTITEIVAN